MEAIWRALVAVGKQYRRGTITPKEFEQRVFELLARAEGR